MRADGHDDADGFTDDQGAGRSVGPLLLEGESLGQGGVETEIVGGGDGEVALGEAARAAGLGDGQSAQFGRARVEAVGEVAQGSGAPVHGPRRPGAGVERLPGRGDCVVDVRRGGQGDVADDLLGAGRDDLCDAVGGGGGEPASDEDAVVVVCHAVTASLRNAEHCAGKLVERNWASR
jgi:hypothetical protein